MTQSTIATTLPPAHRSILRSKSTSDISSISSDSKLSNITFAPLPEIVGRKRRNNRPIGLATRAEMLRRSRQHYTSMCQQDDNFIPEDEDEIPLPDFGKLMKGLWRSVSRKDKNGRSAAPAVNDASAKEEKEVDLSAMGEEDRDGKGGVWVEEVAWATQVTSPPLLPPDAVERDSGGVTMCAIDNGPFLDQEVGQKLVMNVNSGETTWKEWHG